MELRAYLERIGFRGEPRADLDTLRRVHRGHLENIPYENLDVGLGRRINIDAPSIFDKMVARRRGGWCYEMNGLLAWALEEIGFKVTRMAGGVVRALIGETAIGNHLVLRIDLDRAYLADVGFGDGMVEPIAIEAGAFRQGFLDFRLEELGGGWWRFHNHPGGGAPSFDFELRPADEALLATKCDWLQTAPESLFVQNTVVQRHFPDRLTMLRGRTLKTLSAKDPVTRQINSSAEYVATLSNVFDLDLPEAERLWPKIVARHEQLFGPSQVSAGRAS